jgi:hypothetical protein
LPYDKVPLFHLLIILKEPGFPFSHSLEGVFVLLFYILSVNNTHL